MTYARLYMVFEKDEVEALQNLAETELRDFRSQARLLVREGLERRGLLDDPTALQKRDTDPVRVLKNGT